MNKKILNFIKVLFISLLLAACSTNSKGVIQYYVDGHLYHEQSFNDFNEIELPDNPTKNNCDFAGWYWDENVWKQPATMQSILNKSLSDPLKLYGKWDVFYNVNFDGKGGVYVSGDTEQRVASGESAVAPVFTKDGYILSWSTSLDNITSNLTIDAVWTAAVYYDVVFDGNGGTLFSSNATQRIAKGDSAVAPDFRKYGYSLGWDKSFSNITSDLNVKAIWTKVIADKYTVTFNPNNGEIILGNTIQEIAKGGSAVAPTLTKIGYELSWDKSFTNITNDIKVNAIWTKKNDVTVTFNGNGGQLLTGEEVQTIKYGADAIVPTYTKTGYFLTWDKSFNKVTNDITVTAIWNSKSSSTMTSLSIGTFIDAAYDSINDKIAVIKTTSLVIYNASNMSVAATFTFLNTPKCLDVDNGRAVVGFGTSNQFQIYDLASNSLFRTVTTTIPVSYLVVDGDMIIYTQYNQHCDLYFYNLISEEIIYMSWSVYQPRLAIN